MNKRVLFFGATWCGPCKALKPIVQAAASDFFEYKDVSDEKTSKPQDILDYINYTRTDTAQVPLTVVLVNGVETLNRAGAVTADEIQTALNSNTPTQPYDYSNDASVQEDLAYLDVLLASNDVVETTPTGTPTSQSQLVSFWETNKKNLIIGIVVLGFLLIMLKNNNGK